mmetsp:Transcript_2670/g.5055  ORF Transcript_2670/g.5055 Transcript_2670/m.5055 type:complete len:243 (+) Transcript_2670:63-791(+)|eukprot:CAMPEP_0202685416 /NCGR_PEP_ID=MMETSP1385-20130828/1170_1 /ASSEMBLY_ACC=CAM_ASM_000861 /TAXON_ID=933848 /ORGANISM="Elphidium margaritaceum" /LENGTH=242 /DNA_ID=CAMNT_0049339755 /DNA_START=63 /DNA_END=791 /DNA_ORIENTATION=+
MAAAKKRVLLVVSSWTEWPQTEEEKSQNKTKPGTGWYLPEAAHPWDVFTQKGYEMTWVSPKGGLADCDVGSVKDFASDETCQKFTKALLNEKNQLKTVRIDEVADAAKYDAIVFTGGHGTMWDFKDCAPQSKVAAAIYEDGGVVSAVCHGPAALLEIKLSNGKYLIDGKTVTGFTNEEEEAVKLTAIMPFSLESELKNRGAKFTCLKNWASNVEVSERVVTGQNPGSATDFAKAIADLVDKK